MTSLAWPFWSTLSPNASETPDAWRQAIAMACQTVVRGSRWQPGLYGNAFDWEKILGDSYRPADGPPVVRLDNARSYWDADLVNELVTDVYLALEIGKPTYEKFSTIISNLEKCQELTPNQSAQDRFRAIMVVAVKRVLLRRRDLSELSELQLRFARELEQNFPQIGELTPHRFTARGPFAYGDVSSSRLVELDAHDVAVAKGVFLSYPPEVTAVSNDERRRKQRLYRTEVIRSILGDLVSQLGKAITVTFLDTVIEHTFVHLKPPEPIRPDSSTETIAWSELKSRVEGDSPDFATMKRVDEEIAKQFMGTLTQREVAILAATSGRWGERTSQQIARALIPPISRQRLEQIKDTFLPKFRSFVEESHSYLDLSGNDQEQFRINVLAELHRNLRAADVGEVIDLGQLT